MTSNETLNDLLPSTGKLGSDLVELLQEMGLTPKEVHIYEYLLTSGGAIPSAIARDMGQPRGRIYEGMRNLVEKGFVRERPTRPILFVPTPLADVLAAAQARLSRHLHAVKSAQAVMPPIKPVEPVGPRRPIRMRDVSVLAGRRGCFAEITRMVQTADKYFWIGGGGHFPDRLTNMPIFLDAVEAAAARGVDVRIIVPKPVALGRRLALVDAGRERPLLHFVAGDAAGPLVSCSTESASLEMLAQPDDDSPSRGDDVAIHVADGLFAARARLRLEAMLKRPDHPMANGSADKANLPLLAATGYPWLGPDHGSDIFGEGVGLATREVQVLGPRQWTDFLRSNPGTTNAVYNAAVTRGVMLRAVASAEAASDPEIRKMQAVWDIRFVPDVPMWLTILDGKEMYIAFPHASLGGQPQFRRSAEPNEIGFYQAVFERLWSTGARSDEMQRPEGPSPSASDLKAEQVPQGA